MLDAIVMKMAQRQNQNKTLTRKLKNKKHEKPYKRELNTYPEHRQLTTVTTMQLILIAGLNRNELQ